MAPMINNLPVDSKACDQLLAAYKREVVLLRNAVQNIPGTADDSSLAIREADRFETEMQGGQQFPDGALAILPSTPSIL